MKLRLLTFWLVLAASGAFAQDFMMQGWYWDYPKDGCTVNNNTYNGPNWTTTLQNQASSLAQGGFTYLWLPPLSRASFGECSNGYDPKDLYDIGGYGLGRTGFGTEAEVTTLMTTLNNNGIFPVADVVYNHRDGGDLENNPPVKQYIEQEMAVGKSAYPSDRYRCVLPIGGATGLGAGDYYIKVRSKTEAFGWSYTYKCYITTNRQENATFQGTVNETEPNGGICNGQGSNAILLNQDMIANLGEWGECHTDEYQLTLSTNDYFAAGDQFIFYLNNQGGGYSDHYITGIHFLPADGSPGFDVNMANLTYQTYTDFTNMPSNQGELNYEAFKPNSTNVTSTFLNGAWDEMLFFYDYDQYQTTTRDVLNNWTGWLWGKGVRGLRMDAVKHFDPLYVGQMLDHLATNGITPPMVVGEFFDDNAGTLASWVTQADNAKTVSTANVRVFDFAMRSALKNACDNGNYDARSLFHSGVVDGSTLSGFNSVTFVNNHDFRGGDHPDPVQNDPMLAYAYILTNNRIGLPTVFYSDYFGVSLPHYPTVNLKTQIDQLINIHKTYIFGDYQIYLNDGNTYASNFQSGSTDKAVIYQLSGGPGDTDLIVVINFGYSQLRADHQVDVSTSPVGTQFSELTGNATFSNPQVVSSSFTNIPNSLYLEVPARSYAVYLASASLPVELAAFEVRRAGAQAHLTWESAVETDFSHYIVERSTDGQLFSAVGQVVGQATRNTPYSYYDPLPVGASRVYYRLKMVDTDESFEYSPVRSLSIAAAAPNLRVSPNPVQGELLVQWQGESAGTFTLWNNVGQPVRRWRTASGTTQQRVATSDLTPGLYLLVHERVDGQREQVRFVKG